jgi:hypothetical protein
MSGYVGIVVDEVAMGQFSSKHLNFPCHFIPQFINHTIIDTTQYQSLSLNNTPGGGGLI